MVLLPVLQTGYLALIQWFGWEQRPGENPVTPLLRLLYKKVYFEKGRQRKEKELLHNCWKRWKEQYSFVP